jgi:hypothetical protein
MSGGIFHGMGREGFFTIPPFTYRTQVSHIWRIRYRLHRLKPPAAREQHTPPAPPLLTTREKVIASISVVIHLYHAPLMVTFIYLYIYVHILIW